MSMAAEVTALVPNWNRKDLLTSLLLNLRTQTTAFREVIVVDNGSTDGSAEAAAELSARVIRLPSNLGFARAVNAGLSQIRTPWVAILNNDVELAVDWLERLLHAARPQDWFLAGKILDWHDRQKIDGTFDLLARSGCAWRAGHGQTDSSRWNTRRDIRMAPLTAVLFRTSTFDKVGQLDEEFFTYLEDVDLGLRCARAGCGGRYVPEAVACHRGSATLGHWTAETVRLISRNQLLLIAKHYPEGWQRRYGWPVLVGQGLWGLLALRRGSFAAFVRGKLEALRLFGGKRAQATGWAEIGGFLEEAEQMIRELQPGSASDLYWKLYLALT